MPVVEPPVPTPTFGQLRTVVFGRPVQLAEKVEVEVKTVLAARLIVPKLSDAMAKMHTCECAGAAESTRPKAPTISLLKKGL